MSERETLPAHLSDLGLKRNPFPQTPDADCYFRTESIERKSSEMLHCVLSGKGFTLLTGEVGTGKSTFLRSLMDDLLTADCAVSFVFNTFLQGRDLLLAVNRDFGLSAGSDLAEDIDRLNHFLLEQRALGKTCVVVIDDAQNLDTNSLELLRLLSNLETRQNKLLQIVLSGQPEILTVLGKPEIRQLASRIVLHTELTTFTCAECSRYVDFRISSSSTDSGDDCISLDKQAQRALYRHSKGNPRRVHLIMDRCMYGVLSSKHRVVGKKLVGLAASEIGAAHIHSQRDARNWALAALIFVGVGVAAWAAAPQSIPTTVSTVHISSPARVVAAQPLNTCLKKIGASKWNAALQNDLNIDSQPAIERSLSKSGLALTRLPPGLTLPKQSGDDYCQWKIHTSTWLLWLPAYPSFNLTEGMRGNEVRWLQTRLAAAGVYTVPVDGIVGVHTLDGLRVFRSQHNLSAISEADAWTLFLLKYDIGNFRQGNSNG